ncbi:MAG: hypothetical protein ABIH52_04235 [Candidatus Aenigmatarchaeota archaeon]|nr:hypothetical protein [Nanoarchaeota archaeon]
MVKRISTSGKITLNKDDKYCLVFSVEKGKSKIKEGYYCYIGEHDENIHKTGHILFLRLVDDHKPIHDNVKRLSESSKTSRSGHLHYFSDNPLFMIEFHDAINQYSTQKP